MLTELVSAAVALLIAALLILRFGPAPSPARRPARALVPYRRQWGVLAPVRGRFVVVRLQVAIG
jgi:hypothetical protein